jgi:glycosyltransferase involved in cell wall biosynthesis
MVYNGLNYPYAPLPESNAAERLRETARRLASEHADRIETGFILHVGGNQWYKNRSGVIQIYEQLCQIMSAPPNLIMVGKPLTAELRHQLKRAQLEHRVIELNTVSNEDLRTLYSAARLFLFPSSEEGFGWPIIEAQACGCTVVIARREPMREIGGDAAVCFEFENNVGRDGLPLSARSAQSAAHIIKKTLIEDRQTKESRVHQGVSNAARFSTTQMLDGYIDLYKGLLQGVTQS